MPSNQMNRESIKKQFARKLQSLMLEKGWNQSETARRAGMGRDNISCYVRALNLPETNQLYKLAKAFRVDPNDLIPDALDISEPAPDAPFEIRQVGEDQFYLRVSQTMSWEQAEKILQAISANKDKANGKEKG